MPEPGNEKLWSERMQNRPHRVIDEARASAARPRHTCSNSMASASTSMSESCRIPAKDMPATSSSCTGSVLTLAPCALRAAALLAPTTPDSLDDDAGSLLRRAVPGAGSLITRCTVGVSSSSPHSDKRRLSSSSLPCKIILLPHPQVRFCTCRAHLPRPLAQQTASQQQHLKLAGASKAQLQHPPPPSSRGMSGPRWQAR